MTDAEIRQPWLANFPKQQNDPEAAQICRSICDLIVQRAEAFTILGTVGRQIMYLYRMNALD